jgi:hypothetical protein
VVKYLGVANIAKLSWCQQYFKFTAVNDEKGFQKQYLRLLKEKGGEIVFPARKYQGDPGRIIKYKDIKNLDMFGFLKLCDYSIFTGGCKPKDTIGGMPIIVSSDEFYLKKDIKK